MKTFGIVILGLIALVVIVVLIVVEIIEFAIGAVLFLIALGVFWFLWKKVKNKFDQR